MSWFKLRSHKSVDLAQTMPLSSSDKAGKAKKKSHFSFKNLFKSHKPKESVVADSNKSQVEKKSFFGRKKKTAQPEAFKQNSEIYKSQAPKYRHKHSPKTSNDNLDNNSSLYNSYSGAPVVPQRTSQQLGEVPSSVNHEAKPAAQPPINNNAGMKIGQNTQSGAKLVDTPTPEPTVSGGVGNVDPGIKPSVDPKIELTEKQSAIKGYQQEYQECYDLWRSLDAVPKGASGRPVKLSNAEAQKRDNLFTTISNVLNKHLKPLTERIEVASDGVQAALKGDNKLSTEAQEAYEKIDPKQFGQIKAEIAEINKEIANFKVEVAVAQQQKTLDTCMAEKKVLSDALPKLFSYGSSDSEFMKFNDKLVEISSRIRYLRPQHLDSERFVNNPGSVQVEVGQIQADLAVIRNELKNLEFRELTNAEKELTQIKENIKKLPRSPEKTRYLSAINKGLRDLKNTRAAYEPKDISKWSPMPMGGRNGVGMNFYDEVTEITNSVKNAIPEAVREGKEMPSVAKPVTPSVSTTKPSAEEIEAARSAFSQTYELYEKLRGTKLEDDEASLEKDYENQMQHLQSMREYITNNVSVKDGKWDLLKQINGQMQATKKEYEDVHGNFEANEVVQGYKAVKTAMDNLQQAIDGKGDLKTCQAEMENAQKNLFRVFIGKDQVSEEDVNGVLQYASKGRSPLYGFNTHLGLDVSDLINDMKIPEDVKTAFQDLDPEDLPQEVEDFNTYVEDAFQDRMEKLTSLRDLVRKELKDGPEKTKFLNDINQGIAELRELKKDWTASASALKDLDVWKEEFGSGLNDIMKLTQTDSVIKKDRLQALKNQQKTQEAKAKDAFKPVNQEAWNNFVRDINDRCDEQTNFLEGLKKALANDIPEDQKEEFNTTIADAIAELQDTRDECLENTEGKFNKDAEAFQKKAEESLDKDLQQLLRMFTLKFKSLSEPIRNHVKEQDHGWSLNMEMTSNDEGFLRKMYDLS